MSTEQEIKEPSKEMEQSSKESSQLVKGPSQPSQKPSQEPSRQLPKAFHIGRECPIDKPCPLCHQNATNWKIREHRREQLGLTHDEAHIITPYLGRLEPKPGRNVKSLPCIHLGLPTGDKRDCEVCGGSKNIPLYNCTQYGICTVDRPVVLPNGQGTLPWCMTCQTYTTPNAPIASPNGIVTAGPMKIPVALKWACGITTVPSRRTTYFPITLQSISLAGFSRPWIFIDGADTELRESYHKEYETRVLGITSRYPKVEAYANWVLSMWELFLRYPDVDRYVLFQDDLVLSKNTRRYLESVAYPPQGYLNLYTFPDNDVRKPRASNGKGTVGWFHPQNCEKTGLGALALVFSREAVHTLLRSAHLVNRMLRTDAENLVRRTQAIDGAVVEAMKGFGWKEYVHHPSLTQHIGDNSSIRPNHSPQPHSPSFRGEDFDALQLLRESEI